MNKYKRQGFAFFISLLVVFLPFYVSDAYAVNLNIQKISGFDEIDGFVLTNDLLTIEAEAEISTSEDVEPEKLRIYAEGVQGYTYFQACDRISEGGAAFLCTYTAPLYNQFGTREFRVDLHSGVTQYDDAGTPLASETKSVTVDNAGAKIKSISADPERSHQTTTNITYVVQDFGADETDIEHCAGVQRIEFYLGDYAGELVKVEYPSQNLCEYSSSFTYDTEAGDGKTTICARAYDRLNQTNEEPQCADFFVDSGAPIPDQASFKVVKHGTDETLDFIGTNSILADLSFVIDAEDLVVDSVKADLSNMAGNRFANAPYSSYISDGSLHTFSWENIPIGPITACIITVDTEDTIGNSDTTALQCGIKADNDGPAINGLFTNFEQSGIYYVGENTTIRAEINEQGVGIEKGHVFADLSNLGLGSRMMADTCITLEEGVWDCFWYDVVPTVRDGNYPVTILKETRDDLDNIMNASYIQQIGVDTSSPEINEAVDLNVIAGVTDVPYEGIIIPGDTLEFTIEVSDAWSATANFSDLGGSEEAIPESCWRENESTFCLWEVPIMASGTYDADVTFSFLDFTGNYNSISKVISVAGTLDAENPNYWEHTVSCSPQFIDREISSLITMPVYCRISMRPINNADSEIMSFNMQQYPSVCYASVANQSVTDFVQNVIVINNPPGSAEPYLEIALQSGDFIIDEFEFSCAFEVFSKIGEDYTLNPEIENVTIGLSFYETPVGYLEDQYEDRIDEIEDNWLFDVAPWFDQVMVLAEWASRACEIYSGITTAIAGISIIGSVLASFSKGGAKHLTSAWIATCNADSAAKKATSTAKKFTFDKFCSFMNCKWSDKALKGTLGKWRGTVTDTLMIKDVKDSIITSLATLCIPGIIHNYNKWKQIQCRYLTCLIEDVPQGYPKAACDEVRDYLQCRFLYSSIFNAIPFVQFFSDMMENLMKSFSDPLAAFGYIWDKIFSCQQTCKAGLETSNLLCAIPGTLSIIGDAINEINLAGEKGEDYWSIGEDYCEEYRKAKEDAENDDDE